MCCLGALRVPFPDALKLSLLGKLGFPVGRAGTPLYNPPYWVIPNGISWGYGGNDYIYSGLVVINLFGCEPQIQR